MKFAESAKQGIDGVNNKINSLLDGSTGFKRLHESNKLAHRIFELDQSYLTQQSPILAFQYFVDVKYNPLLSDYVSEALLDFEIEQSPGFVRNIKLPDVSIDTNTLNEYNRKRLVHQKVEYSPVTISFFDLINGNTKKLWQLYYQYYFADGRFGKSDSVKEQKTNAENFDFSQYGYNLDLVGNTKHLIHSIDIYQVASGFYNKTTLYNPRIVEFSSDTLSYESSDIIEVNYTIEYEWATFSTAHFGEPDLDTMEVRGDEVLQPFFERSHVLDFAEWVGLENEESRSFLGQIQETVGEIKQNINAAKDAVDSAKNLSRNIASRTNQFKSFVNKIETDVLGRDEPRNNIPSARDLSPIIESVPSSYGDVMRNVRRNRAGSPFSGDNNNGQIQWPSSANPSDTNGGQND